MDCYLLIDFGSTYTKLCLVDIKGEKIVATDSSHTTVATNIIEGYNNVLSNMRNKIDLSSVNVIDTLACSSAAGGLKIVAIGITPFYTVEAAQKSALGAGGRILKSYGYFLDDEDIEEIDSLKPDMILLSGGAEGGNSTYIIKNAIKLTQLTIDTPIIVAGNSYANERVAEILTRADREFYITENIMPDVNMINPEPVREVIRESFMKRIVHAKGLEDIQKITRNLLMPTPTAVLKATELLARGPSGTEGKGEIMVVDIGGATTDIHTVSEPLKDKSHFLEGLKEPYIKRTVEGDLGMRYSAVGVYEYVGEENFLRFNDNLSNIRGQCEFRHNNPEIIMEENKDIEFDEIIAKNCVEIAVRRHSGTTRPSYYGGKQVLVQKGKDLRDLDLIIGTGGIIVNSLHPGEILKLANGEVDDILTPKNPKLFLDKNYILSAMGLLSMKDKELAYKILLDNIIQIA